MGGEKDEATLRKGEEGVALTLRWYGRYRVFRAALFSKRTYGNRSRRVDLARRGAGFVFWARLFTIDQMWLTCVRVLWASEWGSLLVDAHHERNAAIALA